MKAKLIKEKDGKFHLWLNVGTKDADHISSNEPLVGEWGRNLLKYKLSLENCQAIERGYDLDELAGEYANKELNVELTSKVGNFYGFSSSFKAGFQKALEILGDKKFTEDDMGVMMEESILWLTGKTGVGSGEFFDKTIQSLQQTEWDVEVEMICPHPADTYRCGIQYGCDEDGCNHPNQVPHLDADGCLILKRVV